MTDPLTSSAAIAIAAGTITLSGSAFGVQYDTLLAGFIGGLLSLYYLPPMSPGRSVCTVAGSALIAGYFAPVLAAAALHYFPWLHQVGDLLPAAGGAALGIAAQVLIPALLKRLRSYLGGA